MKKILKTIIIALTMTCTVLGSANAHSGRTDANGGHKDNKNKSGLGSYHYHCGGHEAHLHPNGVCPYAEGGQTVQESKPTETIAVSNAPSSINMGQQYDLSYSITGNNKSSGKWTTSDSSIIEVSDTGSLYGKGVGTATVTLSTANSSKSFTVTVQPIEVESITLSENNTEIQIGKSKSIKANVNPDNATNKTLTWKSADYNIASVDQDGNITAIAPGETTISAVSNNNIVVDITVKAYEILPQSIEFDSENLKVEMTKNFKLEPKVMPEDANYDGITFECDNKDVATIDSNGEITPVSLGQANITITAGNISRQIPIEVFETNAESIHIIKNSDDFIMGNYIDLNKTFSLEATTSPEDATYKNFTWTSSNPEVIAVTDNNEFVTLKEGKATLTVCNEEGIEASIEITVKSKSKVYGLGYGGILLLGGVGGFAGYKKGLFSKGTLEKLKR